MTKITVDKDLIEQAIDAAFSPYCTQDLAILVPALRAALAEPEVEPVAKHCMPHGWVINWLHPDGGTRPVYHPSSIQPKFGNDMKPDMYPVYTSPPPPAEVPLLSDEEMMEMVTANAGYGGTNFDRVARAIEQAVRQKAGLK